MSALLALALAAGAAVAPPDSALAALQRELAAIARSEPGLEVGVAAIEVESGRGVSTNGETRFFLASVVKLPIAVAFLRRVEAGSVDLDRAVTFGPTDLRLGAGPLAERYPRGATLTAGELLETMIVDSDNTASDLILGLAGGPAAVSDTLRVLGLGEIRVDRPEGAFLLDYYGIDGPPPDGGWTRGALTARIAALPSARQAEAARRFRADTRDAASPLAVASLLRELARGALLAADDTERLLALMTRGRIRDRLPAGLPPGAEVPHKTGSWSAEAVHDVGLLPLPDGRRVAVAVFVRSKRRDEARATRVIARAARAVFDGWPGESLGPGEPTPQRPNQ